MVVMKSSCFFGLFLGQIASSLNQNCSLDAAIQHTNSRSPFFDGTDYILSPETAISPIQPGRGLYFWLNIEVHACLSLFGTSLHFSGFYKVLLRWAAVGVTSWSWVFNGCLYASQRGAFAPALDCKFATIWVSIARIFDTSRAWYLTVFVFSMPFGSIYYAGTFILR